MPINIKSFKERTFLEKIKCYWWMFNSVSRFRVHYKDNEFSIAMSYYHAKNYRDIFGGQIVVDFNNPPWQGFKDRKNISQKSPA